MTDAVDNFLSTSLARYLAFRVIPVYVTVVFVTVTAGRIDASASRAAAITVGTHILLTNLRAIVELLRRREHSSAWVNLIAFNLLTCVLLIATAFLAFRTSSTWKDLIPSQEDTVVALWTGALAAILAVFLRNLVVTQHSEDALFERARKDLGPDLWTYAAQRAAVHSSDADLIRAILLAEVIQRPAWTRSLERTKGKVLRRGTYGVAQIGSSTPITDEESIDLLCQEFASYRLPRHPEYGHLLDERFRARIEKHNPNVSFVNQVVLFYERLAGYHLEGTEAKADDGRPVIEVKELRRRGQSWEINGTAVVFEGNVVYSATARGREILRESVLADLGAPNRGEWSVSLPLAAEAVVFEEEPMDEDAWQDGDSRTVKVDLS
nr:Gmad2 immunoglobulin-like domain-containing protein [Jiangella mangrovi]